MNLQMSKFLLQTHALGTTLKPESIGDQLEGSKIISARSVIHVTLDK